MGRCKPPPDSPALAPSPLLFTHSIHAAPAPPPPMSLCARNPPPTSLTLLLLLALLRAPPHIARLCEPSPAPPPPKHQETPPPLPVQCRAAVARTVPLAPTRKRGRACAPTRVRAALLSGASTSVNETQDFLLLHCWLMGGVVGSGLVRAVAAMRMRLETRGARWPALASSK